MIKYFFTTVLVFCISLNLFSQESNTSYNFGDSYYLLTKSDGVNNFYVVDFTKFPANFEKIYFKNLVYQSKIIVSIDADINKGLAKFQANKKYDEATVKNNFDDIIAKTISASQSMNATQKEEWLKKNSK